MKQIEQEPPPGPKQNFETQNSKLIEKGEASLKNKKENESTRDDKNDDSDSGLDSCSIGKSTPLI